MAELYANAGIFCFNSTRLREQPGSNCFLDDANLLRLGLSDLLTAALFGLLISYNVGSIYCEPMQVPTNVDLG
jgi:hypothetical protein